MPRVRPPQPLAPWSDVRDALTFGPFIVWGAWGRQCRGLWPLRYGAARRR